MRSSGGNDFNLHDKFMHVGKKYDNNNIEVLYVLTQLYMEVRLFNKLLLLSNSQLCCLQDLVKSMMGLNIYRFHGLHSSS